MNDNHRPRRERRRGSVLGPIILIALGVIFLLSNVGLVTGDVWTWIWRLWPLLLVAIGLDGLLKREGIVSAVLFLGLGVVFLLSNFGLLALNIWGLVTTFWPVVLIAIGFDLVLGRRSWVASLIGAGIALALLAGAVWLSGARLAGGQALATTRIAHGLQGAQQAMVQIEPGAAALQLGAMDAPDGLIVGSVPEAQSDEIREEFSLDGDTASYTLSATGTNFIYVPGQSGQLNWALRLNPELPIDLQVNQGAGQARLDLTALNLSDLQVNLGVGQVVVLLPQSGQYEAAIDGAIGQLEVVIPPGLGVRLTSDTGLAGVDVPDGFVRTDDGWVSPNFESAEAQVRLHVSQAIGVVTVRQR